MSQPTYGGQAVVEGVMVRGPRAMAVAVRRPDGEILARVEPLGGLFSDAMRRVPFLRGIFVLWETLALGARALTWSAAVGQGEVTEPEDRAPIGVGGWLAIAATMGFGAAVFFVGPALVTFWLDGLLPADRISVAIEGLLRILFLVGYLRLVGRSEDIRRVFQYHGAEHMTIAAFEAGRELRVPAIRRFSKEHPRCGTSFLLTVALISGVVFIFTGTEPLWWRFASRLLLVPLIAAVAYEVIRFAGSHQRWPVVRWLFTANLALQRLTTREPDDEHIQVAIEALEQARMADPR